jgi:outer membrane protein assembly factor BamA
MYDTDIGVGYGGKVKFVDFLSKKESFDLILFNSSKGERWYVFTFSIPDFEIRQGKTYGLSFDLRAEYDKYLKYYFYGLGPESDKDDVTTFSYEKKELMLTFGHGFSPRFYLEGGYVIKSMRYFSVEEGMPFTDTLNTVGKVFSPFVFLVFRYDTSDSQIHPTRGERIIFQNDLAGKFMGNSNASYHRLMLDIRKYFTLIGEKDVVAVRGLIQKISGDNIPLFELPFLGGGATFNVMRGYKLNRFADKGKILLNAEYRFPLWRRLGGNLFIEAGSVWPDWDEIDFGKFCTDLGWGLRYYLDDFCVRFDMGFSKEGMGIYFNFGHIF